jgi:hypothetical protein
MMALPMLLATATPAASTTTCGPLNAGWKASRSGPDFDLPVNVVVLHDKGHPPTWNGSVITEQQAREYLSFTAKMNPVPVLVLVVTAGTDCREAEAFRRIASELLPCGQGKCVEVAP